MLFGNMITIRGRISPFDLNGILSIQKVYPKRFRPLALIVGHHKFASFDIFEFQTQRCRFFEK